MDHTVVGSNAFWHSEWSGYYVVMYVTTEGYDYWLANCHRTNTHCECCNPLCECICPYVCRCIIKPAKQAKVSQGTEGFNLSVCLSSVCCLSSVVCLSVCHQTPPSLWNRSLLKFIFEFFRPLQGSVKI